MLNKCTHVCTCVHVHIHTWMCIHVYVYMYMFACMHVRTWMQTHVHNWTSWNRCIQTANTTNRYCLKLLPRYWGIVFTILRGQRSQTYIMSSTKVALADSLWVLKPALSIHDLHPVQAPLWSFNRALVRMLCLLEGLEEQLFWAETTLQPLLKCRKQEE